MLTAGSGEQQGGSREWDHVVSVGGAGMVAATAVLEVLEDSIVLLPLHWFKMVIRSTSLPVTLTYLVNKVVNGFF
jgi:hypothetical protein